MRTLLWPAAIVLLPLFAAGCTKAKPKPTAEEKVVPAFKLSVDDFAAEYKKNQIGADQKYKDKVVQLTGKVSDIGKLPTGLYYIDLESTVEGELFGIKCILEREDANTQAKAGTLKAGDTVTVVGKCQGKALGQALYLNPSFIPQ